MRPVGAEKDFDQGRFTDDFGRLRVCCHIGIMKKKMETTM